AAVAADIGEDRGLFGLRESFERPYEIAFLVEQPEVLAVEVEMRCVFAREDRVGLRTRGNEDRARGQRRLAERVPDPITVVVMLRHAQRSSMAEGVDFDGERRQAFRKADTLLERLLHLLVIERIGRTVDQSPTIRDRRAAPALQEFHDARVAMLACGRVAL